MFPSTLKILRKASGYKSQQAFADAFGVAQSTVGMWEAGKREPNYETTIRLSKFFNVSIDYLLGNEHKAIQNSEGMEVESTDGDTCIRAGCENEFCSIRKKPRDLKKVNIFYDIRRTRITRLGFLEETKVELEKGVKVFPRPVARTDAEIWLKIKQAQHDPIISKHIISPKRTPLDRREEHFSKYHRTLTLLCEVVPELAGHIDLENNAIEGGTAALRANTEALIPVIRAKSACDHLRLPSSVDSKILIIAVFSFTVEYNRIFVFLHEFVGKTHIS